IAAGDAGPAGGDDRHDRSALQDRAPAGLVDRDHARGAVAPGARRGRLGGGPREGGGCLGGRARVGPGLPPHQSVWSRFTRWRLRAVLDRALAVLVACRRLAAGRKRRPTAAIIDTRSVKTGPQRGPRGYDAGEKVKGRKRVLLVGVEGDPLGLRVVPADVREHRALRALAPDPAPHPTLRLAWLDRGFAGEEPGAFLNRRGIAVEVVGIKDRRGFQLEKRRWKAEQTFGCLLRYRRLRVDDEMSCETSRGMAMLAALFMTGMRLERLVAS